MCGLSRDTRPRGRRDVFRGLRGATGAAAWPQTSVPVALALLVQRHPHRDALSMLTHLCPRPATLSLFLSFSRLSSFALANARIRSFARFLRRSRYRSLIFSPSLISFSLFLEIEIRIEIEKKKSRIFIDEEDRDRAIRGERKREL